MIDYASVSENNDIKTQGEIVRLRYGPYGGSILLSDVTSHYVLAPICHACVSDYWDILSSLKEKDRIEGEGIARSTSPTDWIFAYWPDFSQDLPDEIGMVDVTGKITVIK